MRTSNSAEDDVPVWAGTDLVFQLHYTPTGRDVVDRSRVGFMTYQLTYPDGRTETILSVPRYDFNWQLAYDVAQPNKPRQIIKTVRGREGDCA